MSPELERLLEAYHETLTSPPDETQQRAATLECLLNDVLIRRPQIRFRGISPRQTADTFTDSLVSVGRIYG